MMKRIPSDWLLRLAWACPIVIFVCMLIGWRLSNRLYTDVDGAFAKWNFEYAFEWGHWFDLAIFNPFAGLGSTFWSNTPWLNPGAWALQLPFSPLATVTLSYLAQFAAYALTLYWLGRAAGVSRLAAVYALGLFILFNLPPFNYFWGFITPYPIAPFLLVTAAAANLILLALIIAAEPHDRLWLAKAVVAGLAGLVWGIYASATYFMFDLLIVVVFLVILLLCSFRQPARCGRLLLVAAVLTAAFAASGVPGYLDALRAISGRGGPQFSQLIIGLNELVFDEKVRSAFLARALGSDGVLTFWCERPGSALPSCASPAGALLLLPILLCSYAVFTKNVLFRAMLLSCLVLQLGVWFLMAKAAVGIALINLSVGLIATSSALTFLVLPYMIVFDRLQRLVDRRKGSIEGSIALAPGPALDPVRGRLARSRFMCAGCRSGRRRGVDHVFLRDAGSQRVAPDHHSDSPWRHQGRCRDPDHPPFTAGHRIEQGKRISRRRRHLSGKRSGDGANIRKGTSIRQDLEFRAVLSLGDGQPPSEHRAVDVRHPDL